MQRQAEREGQRKTDSENDFGQEKKENKVMYVKKFTCEMKVKIQKLKMRQKISERKRRKRKNVNIGERRNYKLKNRGVIKRKKKQRQTD